MPDREDLMAEDMTERADQPGPRDWRSVPWVAALGVALFLLVSLALPLSRLGNAGQSQRFGWQMFSEVNETIVFTIETDAETITVDAVDYMADPRGDIPILDLMPAHLCEVFPDAILITWEVGSHQC